MNSPEATALMEGILLVDKPQGRTSFSLIRSLRRLTGIRKIGHAGTLDPFATGVMVMLIGREYTRLSDKLLFQDKEYIAELSLGVSTDTYDCDGKVVARSKKIPSFEQIENALGYFQGEIEQIPPMFSAKKIGGKKLYELARNGEEIERTPAIVKVETSLLTYNYPNLCLRIACSKGTYIRSIAHELGQRLGCGAHLSQLKRTRSGSFTIEECLDGKLLDGDNFDIIPHLKAHEDHLQS
ncbi:MAG: tRNA pseudouridine(55) synthase TruB [Chlamydiales bacterium]|nr:tRNA pseudouridine(55) synthase TruB [Chlamydiales bacterium]